MAVPSAITAGPLDGTELVRVVQNGKFVWASVASLQPVATQGLAARVAADESAQAARDAAQDQAASAEVAARQSADTAEAQSRAAADASEAGARGAGDQALTATLSAETAARTSADQALTSGQSSETSARIAGDAAEASTRAAADTSVTSAETALAGRVTTIENKPEEAAHFTASKALPAIAVLTPITLTLTGLVPAKTGDVLKAGESVSVEPATALPSGVNLSACTVPADGTVAIQLTAALAISAQATPITWNITALR